MPDMSDSEACWEYSSLALTFEMMAEVDSRQLSRTSQDLLHVAVQSVAVKLEMHYSDTIMSMMVSPITGLSIVCSTVCSGADQRKHQSSTSLAFVSGIRR